MIRARATTKAGRKMIILGITERNVARLREDKPIHIHADDMGFVGEIVIILGKDEETLTLLLKQGGFIGPDTVMTDEGKRKRH